MLCFKYDFYFCSQCKARVSAVPLHHRAHAGPGPRAARQRLAQRAAVTLALLLQRQRAAADEQTLPPVHHRVCGCLPLAGRR